MLFNSLEYLVFLPLVVLVYFSIPHRWRWLWLLAASYYFYMSWKPIYGILLFATTLLDYGVGIMLGRTETPSSRWLLLLISLVSNLGMLFYFKYYNFAAQSATRLLGWFDLTSPLPHLDVVLPIGISFYVLQSLGYTIDVFRRRLTPEPHLGIFMLYVSFFPQLVAGPIERAGNLLPQLRQKHFFNEQRASDGLKLIVWGFFKKLVIADNLSFFVDPIFATPENYNGWAVLIAAYFFAIQIYCDFSGYADIAIGSARILGIDLMENFRRPFFSRSIREFWQRWHISLTTWFRDYVYFPLGGSRGVSARRADMNTFAVFFLSGLWHGARWTYVVWGVLNGLFYLVNKWIRLPTIKSRPALMRGLFTAGAIFLTFNLFALSLVFFRASGVREALYLLSQLPAIFTPASNLSIDWRYILAGTLSIPTLMFVWIAVLFLVEALQEFGVSFRALLNKLPAWNRWAVYYLFAMIIIVFGSYSTQTVFIYFQF